MGFLCYTGTEEQVTAANSQINTNCGFPDGYTDTWDIPTQAYNQDFWFIKKPPVDGYKEPSIMFSQAEMIAGVTNVTEQTSDDNWWPPLNPPKQKRKFLGLFNAKSS